MSSFLSPLLLWGTQHTITRLSRAAPSGPMMRENNPESGYLPLVRQLDNDKRTTRLSLSPRPVFQRRRWSWSGWG